MSQLPQQSSKSVLYKTREPTPDLAQAPEPENSIPTPDPTHDETHHPTAEPGNPILTIPTHNTSECITPTTSRLERNDKKPKAALPSTKVRRVRARGIFPT